MGRYVGWSDVVGRYRELSKWSGEDDAWFDSSYIAYAETELEGRLASRFTVPFSSNNLTVRDLAIDATYVKAIWRTDLERAKAVAKVIDDRIDRLLAGRERLVLDDGMTLGASGRLWWSTTEDYEPTFGMADYDESYVGVDSDRLQDEEDARTL